jgi:transcription elongation GreA/GreB family factor
MKLILTLLLAACAFTQAQEEESAYTKWKRQSDAYIAWSEASTARMASENAANRAAEAAAENAQAIAELQHKLKNAIIDLENQQAADAIALQQQINAVRLQTTK